MRMNNSKKRKVDQEWTTASGRLASPPTETAKDTLLLALFYRQTECQDVRQHIFMLCFPHNLMVANYIFANLFRG